MKRTAVIVGVLGLAALAFPFVASAVSFEDPSTSLGLGTSDLKETVINIINWVLGLLGIIAVIMILYSGFIILTAGGGSEDRVAGAKRGITAAIIGLVVILLAWAIVNFVLKTTANVTGAA